MPHTAANAPAEGRYVVTQADSELPNASVLTAGDGISISGATISAVAAPGGGQPLAVESGFMELDGSAADITLDANSPSFIILLNSPNDVTVNLPDSWGVADKTFTFKHKSAEGVKLNVNYQHGPIDGEGPQPTVLDSHGSVLKVRAAGFGWYEVG
jgi:hypothetical protein